MPRSIILECVKNVYNACKDPLQTCVSLFTGWYRTTSGYIGTIVQTRFSTLFTLPFASDFSPMILRFLNLFEHNFYPLSTAPITSTTKEILI